MPRVKINGVETEVPPGTNMIEAARTVGVEIPHYCYHPHLSIAGNCRMCLVDIEAGGRGPDIACNMEARDGLAIRTDTERVTAMRKSVMELLLKNHPLDCPICDQSGECRLQDYYMDYGRYDSRLVDAKVTKGKRLDIGEHIVLDQERCVACSRCVRFGDEVTGTGELRLFNRTDGTTIDIFPGERLGHAYQGNLADICPVGALTIKEFRFRKRVWYLKETPSVCDLCATGCNVRVCHQRNEVHRLLPRRNDAVNRSWMCDIGRLGFERHLSASRVAVARVEGRPSRTEDAVAQAARELKAGRVGLVLGAQATLEANLALVELARHLAGSRLYFVPGNDPGRDGVADELLLSADKNPNSVGAGLVAAASGAGDADALRAALEAGELETLVVLRDDVLGRLGVDAPPGLIYLGAFACRTLDLAPVVLPAAVTVEQEGTYVNRAGRVQRFERAIHPLADARPDWELVGLLALAAGARRVGTSAAQVFDALAPRLQPLAGMSWAALGGGGLPTATENREPGAQPAAPTT